MQLGQLEELRQSRHPWFNFDVADQDEILTGINLEQHRIHVIDGTYFSQIGPKILWWFELWESVVTVCCDGPQHKTLEQLADNVMGHYARIRSERPAAEKRALKLKGAAFDRLVSETTDADLNLLKAYRRFTCQVRDLARRAYPNIDLGWLWATA